jgi:hypothetical protein
MTITKKIKIAEQTLDTIREWIKAADQKVSIFLAFQGITLTLLIPNYLKSITARFQTNTMSYWNEFFIISATLLLALAICNALDAVLPRLGNNKKNMSLLYFGSIAAMSPQQYTADMKNLTEAKYLDELLSQIHINSKIAYSKHKKFWNSIIFFIIGMTFFVGTYISLKFL